MEETTQKQNEISLMDILRLLLSKIKLLILVVLCGVVVGAGFGVLRTYNVEYYGSTMEFYVNPRLDKDSVTETESQYGVYGAYGTHVMEGLIHLLSSELFAEKLMLGANGLPENVEDLGNADLTAKVNEAAEAKTEAEALVKAADDANTALTEANADYKEKTATVETLWAAFKKDNPENTDLTPTEQDGYTELNDAIKEQKTAKEALDNAKTLAEAANEAADTALEESEAKTETALELWRKTDENYYKKLELIVDSVSYSYYDETQNVNVDDLARSFVYVTVNVLNSEEFANDLRSRLIDLVPEFIEENMPVPSGYDGTNCRRISRSDAIDRTNKNVVLTTAVKYGVLLAAAAFIVACVVVVIIDRSDKRLRNIDQVTDLFNVPVLGVIPTIKPTEKENQENSTGVTK